MRIILEFHWAGTDLREYLPDPEDAVTRVRYLPLSDASRPQIWLRSVCRDRRRYHGIDNRFTSKHQQEPS